MTYFSERYGGTYISLTEAEERTGMSRDFILASVKRGEVRGIEIGRALFIDSASLEAFAEPQGRAEPESGLKKEHPKYQHNAIERAVAEGKEKEDRSGPARFVFEREDVLAATPILAIALVALFLAFPVQPDRPTVSTDMLVLFSSEAVADERINAQNPSPSSEMQATNVLDRAESSLGAQALEGFANGLQNIADFVYGLLGVTDR